MAKGRGDNQSQGLRQSQQHAGRHTEPCAGKAIRRRREGESPQSQTCTRRKSRLPDSRHLPILTESRLMRPLRRRVGGQQRGCGNCDGEDSKRENDPRDLRAEKQGTRNRARQSRSRCARRNLATNHAHGSSRSKDKPEDQQSGETALARQTPRLPELVVVEHGRQVNRQQRNKEQNRRKRFGQRFKRGRTC